MSQQGPRRGAQPDYPNSRDGVLILPLAPGTPIALGALNWTGVLGLGLAVDPAFVNAHALTAAIVDAKRELAGARAHDGLVGPAGTAA
jgi:hypothetical protein